MITTMRENSLLGSYREKDYSTGFQKMMNKVIAKIYRNKGSKHNVFKTLVPQIICDNDSNSRATKIKFKEEITRRKNSEPISSFFLSFPKSNGFSISSDRSKYSLPSFKIPQNCNRTPPKLNKKPQYLPHSQYQESLYQKINDYNTCLITKTYRFQEKDRFAVCLTDTERSQESPSYISKIRKCENFKRNNKWIHSKGKFIKEDPRSQQLQEDFKPWEFDHTDEHQY